MLTVLGIETSCDETAAAVVREDRTILSHTLFSQIDLHELYGGVVPEIGARAHLDRLDRIVHEALDQANMTLDEVDGIAATGGPGLIGGVLVGVMMAKALALIAKKPFIAVNHMEGHALTVRLVQDVPFPFLLLLVSGGHCQILSVDGVGQYTILGKTLDDAVGESFDKVARLLNLPYPGGPQVEQLAQKGNSNAYRFPKPLLDRPTLDFSFSGLKTAVRQVIVSDLTDQERANVAASFQRTVADVLTHRINQALTRFPNYQHFVVAGGVAANQYIRRRLEDVCALHRVQCVAPPMKLCTDNGAMIAWAGLERLRLGQVDGMDFAPRPRWPLGEEMRS